MRELSVSDVDDIARGAAILGAGGGGDNRADLRRLATVGFRRAHLARDLRGVNRRPVTAPR